MDPSQRERYAVRVRLSLASMPIGYTQERIKDRLCFYFQSKQGGNCDVEYIRLMGEDAKCSWYRVAFVEQSGARNVLARPDHAMIVDGIKIPLEVQGFQAHTGTSMSLSSEAPTRSGPRVSRAVAESPSLTAADIQIESEIYGENLQDDPEEEDEKLIEVTGLKITKDDEVLKLCFEIPHIYGGGEIETLERDFKTPGPIRITFTNPSTVTSVVAEKEQMLSQTTLKVKLITKKRDQSLSLKTQCVFLKGIPDGCTTDYLKLLMEYTTSMEEEPMIQYGEKPGTAICTFSTDIPDLEAVTRRISERKVRGVSVTAEKCNQSDAILVQDFSRDSSLEMLELYFDNKKKSGGSEVRDVQPGPVDGQAIVFFEDWRAVQNVLAKGYHKLGGSELLVESYHDFLGRLSPFDAPTPHIPKPVTVEVRESIMEFLYGKGEDAKKKLLLKELAKVKANLQWPDGSQKSQAKIEPVIDESQHQSSWLNWEKEAQGVLTDFMKGYKTAKVPVPQTLWKDAVDSLKKSTTACSMVADVQRHEVVLVGEQRDVDGTNATVNDIIKKLQKKAEYDAEQAKEDISWDAEKLQLFTLCGIKQQIEKSFPALKITVFNAYGKTGITLDGIRKTIKEVDLNIRRMMDSLKKTEFKAGSIKVQFVQRVPDKIHQVWESQDIHAACSGSDDGKITIYGATSRDVREAKAYVDNEIGEDKIAIKGPYALAVVLGHEGKTLLDSINNQKFGMAYISHETEPRCIKLAGFKKNLNETRSKIMNFLKKSVVIRSTIPSNKINIRLITTYHGQEFDKVGQQHQQNLVAIQPQISGRNGGFIIQGNEEGFNAAHRLVTSLVEAVKEKQYTVSKTGMARLFREEKGKKFLESVERKFHCVINSEWQEERDDQAAEYITKKVTPAVYGTEGVKDDNIKEKLQETVILQLCAMDMFSLMKASDKLDRFQEEEFLSEDFPDAIGLIDKMTTEHKAELIQIGRKRDVRVTVEPSKSRGKFIHVEGYKYNVNDALLDISQMFTKIQKEETEKQKREHLSKEVKWKYSTPSGMKDYDEEVSVILEEAYQKKRPNVKLDLEDGRAVIDFQQMQETMNRSVINVHRVDLKSAAKFEPPSNWIPMKQGEFNTMVKLTAGTAEYTAVETKFRASVGAVNNIIEIARIQNQDLIMQYQARRTALENRLNKTNVEMVLYHGTDEQTSKKISSHGFNRSFCGKNATAYGYGTYFAVAASYSASPQYAKPDANGTKHIFVTNVLVGDYIRGSKGMITPPNKPQSPGELFDSVVDNMNAPGIYVIFHDAQAYPEYLIKFQ